MKKNMRKMASLALAVCLTVPMAVAVSAKEYNNSGTYNGHGWGAHDSCNTHEIYIETGSDSEELVYAEMDYYYYFGNTLRRAGGMASVPAKHSSRRTHYDTGVMINHMKARHYMSEYLVDSCTVYAG